MPSALSVAQARNVFNQFHTVSMALGTIGARLRTDSDPVRVAFGQRLGRIHERLAPYQWPMRETEVSDSRLEALLGDAVSDDSDYQVLVLFHHRMTQLSAVLRTLEGKGVDLPPTPVSEDTDDPDDLRQAKQLNLELLAYEAATGRSRLESLPVRHVIDAGSRCNLRCLTCHQSATQDLIHYDVADVPLAVLDPAIRHATFVQIAGMGETMLSRATPALVQAYRRRGVFVELLNNGTMLQRVKPIADSVDMLSISIDGGTAETYNALRRWGNFRALMDSVSELSVVTRRRVCVNFVVCKQNVLSCPDIVGKAAALGLGQVHFAELNTPLWWHDRMALDDADRRWFFEHLPEWRVLATASGVHVVANLTPARPTDEASEPTGTTAERLATVSDVPIPPIPRGLSAAAAWAAIEAFEDRTFPPSLALHLARHAPPRPASGKRARPLAEAVAAARAVLERAIDAGTAQMPHCLASFAHLLVNGNGSTRSCCSVQSQLSTLFVNDFDAVRNSAPYVDLRAAHARQRPPRAECADCRDPLRFFLLIDVLREMKARGVDISLIARPNDFPLPASLADDPLVQELGSGLRDGERSTPWRVAWRRWRRYHQHVNDRVRQRARYVKRALGRLTRSRADARSAATS